MRRKAKFKSINVVPFIDVMLVLLVIVLLSASFVQTGLIKTKLPKGHSSANLKNKKIKITIQADGNILFNNKAVDKNSLKDMLKGYKKDTFVYIYANKDLKFNSFTNVIDALQESGFLNIGIVTKK